MAAGQKEGILWAAVTRDSTTLAEAGQDNHGGAVLELAKKILAKKPSPGACITVPPFDARTCELACFAPQDGSLTRRAS